ncbi:uncharacterized protein N7483_012438 [Penicillium malachiteum]|uniref:uncharacterized protein n=1 Tax=Penicillium malachiteum TaxID=1324776 RepID=UPI0025480596|nr:uncharacterized protein N7483_012438 [Penicillium malachiteum]KAJ5715257.1 hypothetical protein N7483_012438 [Penicillium malachiteum]
MSFLGDLCGCFTRNASPHSSEPKPVPPRQIHSRSSIQTGRFTLSGEGEFIRAAGASEQDGHGHGHGHGPPTDSDGGYSSVVPLPQYTPRPMSIHEKTLEAHLLVNFTKRISYGNTSTATRETPPPPYSPRHSVVLSTRSRSMSVTSAMAVTINPPPMARVNGRVAGRITAPSSEADDISIRRLRRVSWESR